ncbi:MlaD family protein [Fimbriiglobus ruber]|uniref:Mce/MlaD domain-containing protein n=1 Tax=Fimbriiglobus ruber TaxID=1908690 RepID=A0A225DHB8_9BACT|nr:MlaD family protein [Fimbriiglobus ruber]OWK35785.1 hypothetical protein FRUB_08348 [Fimbriiglobus ruber]
MAERRAKIRLGIFVGGSLLVLSALVVLFGGRPGILSNRVKYTLLFPEAPGVGPGTPVRKSGVRIGEVGGVDLDEETGQVRVAVEVEKKFMPRPTDEPAISRGILSGDTTIDFVPKSAAEIATVVSREPYPPDSEIPGVPPVNTRILLKEASGVIPTAQESIARLLQSMERFERVAPKAERALDEVAGLARTGREIVPELRQTNARIQDLIGANVPGAPDEPVTVRAMMKEIIDLLKTVRPAAEDLRAMLKENGPDVNKTLKSVRDAADSANDALNPENRKAFSATLKNLQAASDDLTKMIRLVAVVAGQAESTLKELQARIAQTERVIDNVEKVTRPLVDAAPGIVQNVDQTVKNLRAASEQLSGMLANVQTLVKSASSGEGTVQKLLTDPSLFANLNDATVSAARTLARVEKITRDLEVFADKIARRPETLGAGGIVRPSTGLKESPDAPLPPSAPLPIAPTRNTLPQQPAAPPAVAPIPPVPLEGAIPVYKPTTNTEVLPPRR